MTKIDKAMSHIHVTVDVSPYNLFKEDLERLIKQYIVDETCPHRWGIDAERSIAECGTVHFIPTEHCQKHWKEEFVE